MRKYSLSSLFDIQLFGEGAGAGAAGGGEGGASGAAPAGQEAAAIAQPQKGKTNPLAEIQYGLPDEEEAPVAQEQQEAAPVDRAAQFEKLIKGEYKDLYEQRIKDTISKRLKGNEEKVKRLDAMSPVLELMAKSYGVDASDTEALREAIERDDKYFEDAAIENGTTTAQEREKWRTHLENEQLRAKVQQYDEMLKDQQQKEQADRQYSAWVQEGEQLKQIYPGFDLRTESKNPEFGQLLASGVSVKTAYEVIHKDELISGAMQFASREAEKRVANAVIAGQRRPTEGAASNRAAVQRKTDVSQLTRADREEIDRRVARGEKIRF